MGQTYASSAVIPDGTQQHAPIRDAELYYEPSTFPGRTLPHAWLQRKQERLSTHDLVGRGRFTILTGVGGQAWRDAARAVAQTLGIDIEVFLIGGPNCDAQDVYGTWADVREIDDAGCLLVRPDRHIAWRQKDGVADPEASLLDVLRKILSRP